MQVYQAPGVASRLEASGSARRRDLDEPDNRRARSAEKKSLSAGASVVLESLRKSLRSIRNLRGPHREQKQKERATVADLGLPGVPAPGDLLRGTPEKLRPVNRAARSDIEVVLEPPMENLQSVRWDRVRLQIPADVVDGAREGPDAACLSEPSVDSDERNRDAISTEKSTRAASASGRTAAR